MRPIIHFWSLPLIAYTDSTDLPFGMHPWYFEGGKCSDEGSTMRNLLLHLTVDQPGHFCCGDGSCISSEFVCDYNQHCIDR